MTHRFCLRALGVCLAVLVAAGCGDSVKEHLVTTKATKESPKLAGGSNDSNAPTRASMSN